MFRLIRSSSLPIGVLLVQRRHYKLQQKRTQLSVQNRETNKRGHRFLDPRAKFVGGLWFVFIEMRTSDLGESAGAL